MIMKHLKIKIMSIAFMAVTTSSMAQSLNKMNWLNEPQQVALPLLEAFFSPSVRLTVCIWPSRAMVMERVSPAERCV